MRIYPAWTYERENEITGEMGDGDTTIMFNLGLYWNWIKRSLHTAGY
jgi:hypothetical protein